MTAPSKDSMTRDPDVVFTRKIAIGIVSICVISFIVFLIAIANDSEDKSLTASPSAHSISALGHRAMIDFLRDSGLNVRINHNRNTLRADPETAVLVAEPGVATHADNTKASKQSIEDLFQRTRNTNARLVIVFPKWTGKESKVAQGRWMSRAELRPIRECEEMQNSLRRTPAESLSLRRASAKSSLVPCDGKWANGLSFQTVAAQMFKPRANLVPIVNTENGILIANCLNSFGQPTNVYVVSDPDLLSNHGLARGDNAELLLKFFTEELHVKRVVVDEISHGYYRESSFMTELLEPPLLLITLHGLLVFGLVAWMGAIRFGQSIPLPPRLPSGKAGLIENTAQLLSHRGRLQPSVKRYYDDVIREVGQRFVGRRRQRPAELIVTLQQISDQKGFKIHLEGMRVALGGKSADARLTTSGLLNYANDLYRWRQEMLDER